MSRVAIYCRVSTQEQATDGYSIGEQEQRLKQFCEAHGWSIYDSYIDGGFSGGSLSRPAMQRLIQDAERHKFDKVCVYKLDRLSRSQKDTLYLIEEIFIANGIDFVSMTETLDTGTPFGMAMIGILSVFAQLERATIKERMMLGRDARIKSGLYSGQGNGIIGYDYVDGKLIPNDYESRIVQMVFDRFIRGQNYSQISEWLLSLNFRNRQWSASNIKLILQQPVYIGIQRWKGKETEIADIEKIIEPETWYAVQAEIERRAIRKPDRISAHKHVSLWGGMIWCGKCGKRMSAKKSAKGIRQYSCSSSRVEKYRRNPDDVPCKNRTIDDLELSEIVFAEIKKISLIRGSSSDFCGKYVNVNESEINALNQRIKALKAQQSRIIDLYSVGSIDIDILNKKSADISREIDSAEKQIDDLQRATGLTDEKLQASLQTFSDIIGMASPENGYMELYDIVRQLINGISIDEELIEIRWNFST